MGPSKTNRVQMEQVWLSLKGAANLLGVHPSTVRKWSNEGKLPVHLTQGGHRRYLASEMALWKEAHNHSETADVDYLLQQAVLSVRLQMHRQDLENESWYARMDAGDREYFRTSGRQMIQAILTQLVVQNEDGSLQARALGQDYAARCRKQGLSLVDASLAFLFFRRRVLVAIVEAYRGARIYFPEVWEMLLRKYSDFTDEVLMSILQQYEPYAR